MIVNRFAVTLALAFVNIFAGFINICYSFSVKIAFRRRKMPDLPKKRVNKSFF